ncbi:MAG: hypothetical protein WCO56_26555 [Verrucomicrobiota bacterium]
MRTCKNKNIVATQTTASTTNNNLSPRLIALTPEAFAAAISWHPESVRLACRQGRIKGAIKLGKGWRIPESVLTHILETGIPSIA